MGAAGRDFHVFNMLYRDDRATEIVAFTAAQIPGIAGRRYPPSLAGNNYPEGVPVLEEAGLEDLCRERHVDEVVFAYSDVSHEQVMHLASRVVAAGADFRLLGATRTMIEAPVPVVAICAVRTGCGKSQTARHLSKHLSANGRRVAVMRHPMPYGQLERQAVQRFETLADLDAADCTVEEREEYEPHIRSGGVVYAGVDYVRITQAASAESDIIIWDGGNNDLPFLRPDILITMVDPLRAGHEATYYPGETALRMADVVVVAKANSASAEAVAQTIENAKAINARAALVKAASRIGLDDPECLKNKRVLVIEDGPTLTHGGMAYGAGFVAATEAGAARIVDPRAAAVGGVARTYAMYPHIGPVLPAVGYGAEQLRDLERTIAAAEADVVVVATPCNLSSLIEIDKHVVHVSYDYEDAGQPLLADVVEAFLGSAQNKT
jgi:predicted GTPase